MPIEFQNPGAGPRKIFGPVEAPAGAGGGGPSVPDNDPMHQLMQMGLFGREKGFAEAIENSLDPGEMRRAQRLMASNMERMLYEDGSTQGAFVIDRMMMPTLYDRVSMLEIEKPLNESWTKKERQAGLDRSSEKLELLVNEARVTTRELQARMNLVNRVAEERTFEGDQEEYSVTYFLNGRKQSMDARHYGTIFNAKETYEGAEAYGERVEKSLLLWKNVAEGNAKVVVENKDGLKVERRLPNIFALPANRGLTDAVINKYIVPSMKLNKGNINGTPKERALAKLEEEDCRSAAITALLLAEHFDLPAEWGIGKNGYMTDVVTEEDRFLLTHEIKNDVGKHFYAEQRRASEWRGAANKKDGMREHPRAVGSPSTLGCLPRLGRDALHIMNVEVHATKYEKDNNGNFVRVQDFERDANNEIVYYDNLGNMMTKEKGEPRLAFDRDGNPIYLNEEIKVSIADAVWSGGVVKRAEKGKIVEWRFTPQKFKDVLWDDVKFFVDDIPVEKMSPDLSATNILTEAQVTEIKKLGLVDFEAGVPTNGIEVPYKLQMFLAYNYIFKHFMRTDFTKLHEDVLTPDFLIKMNKGMDNAIGLLSVAFNLDQELSNKLNSYLRVVFLGGLGASLIKRGANGVSEGPYLENQAQTNQDIHSLRRNDYTQSVIYGAAKSSNFLNFKDVEKDANQDAQFKKQILDEKERLLIEFIIDEGRKAPTPFELRNISSEKYKLLRGWFTDDELEILSAMYPLEVLKTN